MPFFSRSYTLSFYFLPVIALCLAMPRSIAFVPGIAGLSLLAAVFLNKERPLIKKDYAFWLVAMFIPALVALTSLWSDDPAFVLERAGKLIGILLPLILLIAVISVKTWPQDALRKFYFGFYLVFCFAALFIMIENLTGQTISGFVRSAVFETEITKSVQYNRSLVVLSLFYLPVVAALQNLYASHKKAKLFHISLATFCILLSLSATKSQTAQLCFMLGAAFYFLYPYVRVKLIYVLTGIIVVAMLAAPFAVQGLYKMIPENADEVPPLILEASIPHRLEVWDFVATETMKSPWIGHGVEALREMKSERWMNYPNSNQILHPHNAPMQIWVEFGLLGALFTCLFYIWLARRIDSLEGQRRRLALCVSICALLVLSVGYGLWQSWQIGLLFFLPVLVILCTDRSLSTESKS